MSHIFAAVVPLRRDEPHVVGRRVLAAGDRDLVAQADRLGPLARCARVPPRGSRRLGSGPAPASGSLHGLVGHRDAVEQPLVALVATGGGVHDAAVVPHHQHVGRPAVAIDELRAGLMAEQLDQDRAACASVMPSMPMV